MKDLSFDLLTPSCFYVNLRHFSKKRGLTRILQQKKSQWWSYRLNYHKNHLFPGTPTNIRIIEITPSLQARDSGNRLCAHLLLFENVSFYEKRMYLLHDTHHGTGFSVFSLTSQRKMKIKMCQFGAISGLATRSISCWWFFEFIFVVEKLII